MFILVSTKSFWGNVSITLIWSILSEVLKVDEIQLEERQEYDELSLLLTTRQWKNLGHQGPLLLTWITFNPSMDK